MEIDNSFLDHHHEKKVHSKREPRRYNFRSFGKTNSQDSNRNNKEDSTQEDSTVFRKKKLPHFNVGSVTRSSEYLLT